MAMPELPSGTVTFNPGETEKKITITIKGDNKKESDEDFFVNLFGASNASIGDSTPPPCFFFVSSISGSHFLFVSLKSSLKAGASSSTTWPLGCMLGLCSCCSTGGSKHTEFPLCPGSPNKLCFPL